MMRVIIQRRTMSFSMGQMKRKVLRIIQTSRPPNPALEQVWELSRQAASLARLSKLHAKIFSVVLLHGRLHRLLGTEG